MLSLYLAVAFRQLREFKALKALTQVKAPIDPDHDFYDSYEALFEEEHDEYKDMIAAMDTYCGFLERNVPGGIALTGPYGLIDAAIRQDDPDILTEAFRCTKQAGIPLDSKRILGLFLELFFDQMDSPLDFIRVLIENEVDLHHLCALFDVDDMHNESGVCDTSLDTLLSASPSIEMFQLLFEEKLIKNNTLTCFEYMQECHPGYPYFWRMPVFSRCLCEANDDHDEKVRPSANLTPNRSCCDRFADC